MHRWFSASFKIQGSRSRARSESGIESPLKNFDAAKDMPASSLNDRLKLKKFNWMPNPFLANNDLRQGGPLYYAKYFQDRDRRLDDKFVRQEVANQADELAKSKFDSTSETNKCPSRRKKAVWSNYRPVSSKELQSIRSLSKIASVLVNELHILHRSGTDERKWVFPLLEERLLELTCRSAFEVNRESVTDLVKCVYHFGIYGELTPVILNKCLEVTIQDMKRLKPENLIYLLEALTRLRFRDQRCTQIIEALALCWPGVRKTPNMLLKAANAISRLDLYSSNCLSLSTNLAEALPNLTPKQLEKIKGITACTVFDDIMLLDYLVLSHQANIEYVRHLLIVYLYIRSRSELVDKIPKTTKEWIEDNVRKETLRKQLQRPVENSPSYTSDLHKDIHRISESLKIESVMIGTDCGPFTFDIYLPGVNAVIEACSEFQFYVRTAKITADARFRHHLIRNLGFKLVTITPFQWNSFKSDEEKASFLSRQLGSV